MPSENIICLTTRRLARSISRTGWRPKSSSPSGAAGVEGPLGAGPRLRGGPVEGARPLLPRLAEPSPRSLPETRPSVLPGLAKRRLREARTRLRGAGGGAIVARSQGLRKPPPSRAQNRLRGAGGPRSSRRSRACGSRHLHEARNRLRGAGGAAVVATFQGLRKPPPSRGANPPSRGRRGPRSSRRSRAAEAAAFARRKTAFAGDRRGRGRRGVPRGCGSRRLHEAQNRLRGDRRGRVVRRSRACGSPAFAGASNRRSRPGVGGFVGLGAAPDVVGAVVPALS